MQIRFLEYLVALDAERHFAKAAERCNVSQPALSAGLVALEKMLGKRLVERDRRFVGLTEEGATVLPWARQMVSASREMIAALDGAGDQLTGNARIGCVPAGIPVMAPLASRLKKHHPHLRIMLRPMTSEAIKKGIDTFAIDAGITYLDPAPLPTISTHTLSTDNFLFVGRHPDMRQYMDGLPLEAAMRFPLCLLPKSAHGRRILDEQLANIGLTAVASITADSLEALIALADTGEWATFLPGTYRHLLPQSLLACPLKPVLRASRIGIVIAERGGASEVALTIFNAAKAIGNFPNPR
ncbi:LysR substrate-binding domain-containing protein [Novosphingobium sp. BL-8A]|uniref:LysR family transcriptional regulator n=1 Tax=Novosphingobium sp. BL-8A TaxID=3127639 RepID=UPI003757047E